MPSAAGASDRSLFTQWRRTCIYLIYSLAILFIACDREQSTSSVGLPDRVPDDRPPWGIFYSTTDWGPAFSNDGSRFSYFSAYDSIGNFSPSTYLSDTSFTYKHRTGIPGVSSTWLPGDSLIVTNTGIYPFFPQFTTYLASPGGESIRVLDIETTVGGVWSNGKDNSFIYTGGFIDSSYATGIFRYDMETGQSEPIVGGMSGQPSPDGQRVVLNNLPYSIWVKDLTDSSFIRISGIDKPYHFPVWSRDGRYVFFGHHGSGIARYDMETGREILLTDWGAGPMVAHPHVDRLMFMRGDSLEDSRLWMMDYDGRNQRQVTF